MLVEILLIITCIAVGLLSFFNLKKRREKQELPNPILPIIVFFTLAFGSIFLYEKLKNKELEYTKKLVEQDTKKILELLSSQINSKIFAINRMASRWDVANGTEEKVWHSDASNYINDLKGLVALEWISKNYKTVWFEPKNLDRRLRRLDRKLLNKIVKKNKDNLHVEPLKNSLIAVYRPITSYNKFDGFMVALFNTDILLNEVLKEDKNISSNYHLSLSHKNLSSFDNSNIHKKNVSWKKRKDIQIYDDKWQLNIEPTQDFIDSQKTLLPAITLISGLLISVLSAIGMWLTFLARLKSNHIIKSNQQIKEYSQQLFESELQHQKLIDSVNNYAIYCLDVKGNVKTWNRGAKNIKQYNANEIIGQNFSKFYTKEDQKKCLPKRALATAIVNGVSRLEGWHVRKDGSKFWASVTISPISNREGKVTGFAKVTHDETERKAFEKRLLDSEERYDLVVRGMSVGMWDWNVITNELYWSEKFKEIMGVGKNFKANYDEFADRLHPDDKEFVLKMLFDHLDHKCPYDVEYRLKQDSGNYVWIHAFGQAQWDENGKAIRMAGSVDDISVRKQAEEERAKLISIVEESTDYIGVADMDGNLQYHNKTARRMVGLPDDYDLSKMKISDMHPKWASELVLKTGVPEVFKNGSWQGENAILHRNGTEIPVSQSLGLHRDSKGNPVCFTTIMRDISDRKKVEQNLKNSEEIFRSAMENASIGMALVSKDGHFTKVNQILCEILGYSAKELLKIDFQSITHPDYLELDLDYVKKMLAGEIKNYQIEKCYYHKNGNIIWALLSVSMAFDSEGKPDHFISQIQDITERKEMDRMKDEFVSIVSHELRTPLTSIRGSLGLILSAFANDLSKKVKDLLNIANNNCERLIPLINDILDMDKITAGKMQFDINKENLAQITKQAVSANQPYAEKFKTVIELKPIDENLKINIDASRYVQVLSNLLSNAAKFSPEGKKIEVFGEVKEGNVRISVKDYGSGISKEFKPRIFSKFCQADSSSARKKGGTGLGLHITKIMVENMGGKIGFDTKENKGTTFWIEFPIARDQKISDDLFNENTKILICENSAGEAVKIQKIISDANLKSDVSYKISEAKEMIEDKKYDVLIFEDSFLNEDGINFITELHGKKEMEKLAIVVISKNDDLDNHMHVFDVLLTKPVDNDELIWGLRNSIHAKHHLPEVLHIEDDIDLSNLLSIALNGKAKIINAPTLKQAKKLVKNNFFSTIVIDLKLPDGSGAEIIDTIPEDTPMHPTPPLIILSGKEATPELKKRVAKAIVKSRTSEIKIIETILYFVDQFRKEKNHE